MWGDRSGREPTNARSPLAFRLVLSTIGAGVCVVALVLLALGDRGTWWLSAFFAAFAVIGVADAVVIVRRMHREERRH